MGPSDAKRRGHLSPTQYIVLGFALIILIGTLLLMLPLSLAPGRRPNVMEAFFTATSSVCITGLVVVETGTHFSIWGQIVILVLMQIGGIGFMSLASPGPPS